MAADSGYYRHPTIHGDRVVFVGNAQVWIIEEGDASAQRSKGKLMITHRSKAIMKAS